jgi:hypothetical protein
MKVLTTTLLIFALMGASMAAELPTAPQPVKSVEHDPGAWAFTTGFTSAGVGIWKHWIGLTAGLVVAVAPNLQDSRAAHQNMVGGIAGAAAGYVLIKTLKRDWHKKK